MRIFVSSLKHTINFRAIKTEIFQNCHVIAYFCVLHADIKVHTYMYPSVKTIIIATLKVYYLLNFYPSHSHHQT